MSYSVLHSAPFLCDVGFGTQAQEISHTLPEPPPVLKPALILRFYRVATRAVAFGDQRFHLQSPRTLSIDRDSCAGTSKCSQHILCPLSNPTSRPPLFITVAKCPSRYIWTGSATQICITSNVECRERFVRGTGYSQLSHLLLSSSTSHLPTFVMEFEGLLYSVLNVEVRIIASHNNTHSSWVSVWMGIVYPNKSVTYLFSNPFRRRGSRWRENCFPDVNGFIEHNFNEAPKQWETLRHSFPSSFNMSSILKNYLSQTIRKIAKSSIRDQLNWKSNTELHVSRVVDDRWHM